MVVNRDEATECMNIADRIIDTIDLLLGAPQAQ
jgi:hypothetical protein